MVGRDVEKMLAVGLVWGATNAFMRRGAIIWDQALKSTPQTSTPLLKKWLKLLFVWQYTLPFLINLSASATFFAILSDSPISVAVPVTNATTFAATAVFGIILGEETRIGLALIGGRKTRREEKRREEMASLPNKLIAQVAFKAGGDIFHKIVAFNPKHLSNAIPTFIQDCELHQGNYGVNGSVIQWKYTVDGKAQIAKQVLQDIDEEKKTIAYKTVEGNVLELYKNILITIHVETKGNVDFITWTIDYELISEGNPHPLPLLNFFICLTKDLESHIFG